MSQRYLSGVVLSVALFAAFGSGVLAQDKIKKCRDIEGGLSATVSSDGKTIRWANGTVWRRK